MKLKHSLLCCLTLTCFLLCSCGKGADENCSASETTARENALSSAQTTLSLAQFQHQSNPSTENCQTYREAYIDYLKALESRIDCMDDHLKSQWNQVYTMQQQELNNIQC